MAFKYKSIIYITFLIATTACLTLSVDDVSVGTVNRQSKQLLLGVIPHHSYYVNQPSVSRFWPTVSGQRPHSILDGSSNYFGIFPAFSGNQNCPPTPTCTTCPAAPPYKEDITTCGGASASPNGTFKIDSSTTISADGFCSYTLVTFKPFNKIHFQCDDLSGGVVLLKTPDGKETALNQGRARVTITIDFGWVTITIKFKFLKDGILEEANPRQTRNINCSWTAA